MLMNKFLYVPLLILSLSGTGKIKHSADDIIGRWMSTRKNLEVEVFKVNNEYKARVIWFDDSDDKSQPTNVRCDKNNPNEELRSRKIVGMEVMHGLKYNEDDDEWQHGWIYDSSSGKTWNSKAWLTSDGRLKVRGFWHFEFLGQTMSFDKAP